MDINVHEESRRELFQIFQSKTVKFIMEQLKEYDVLKKGTDLIGIENLLLRSLGEYKCIDLDSFISNDGSIDEITATEDMLCLKMAIFDPNLYYISNWRELFKSQHFLHDEEWANEVINNDYCTD